MFDTTDQILKQLRAGEDGLAEFKALRLGDRGVLSPNTEDLAGELVAFANAVGGAVFLAVDDSGAVAGIPPERLDAVEHWIVNVATHNCEPPIRPILRKVVLPASAGEERHVLLAEVPRGLYVQRTSGGRYYLRVGSTKRDLTPPELARLFSSADASTCSTSSPSSRPPSTTSIATDSRRSSDARAHRADRGRRAGGAGRSGARRGARHDTAGVTAAGVHQSPSSLRRGGPSRWRCDAQPTVAGDDLTAGAPHGAPRRSRTVAAGLPAGATAGPGQRPEYGGGSR